MGPKAKPSQPRACHMAKKDGPRRTPKHVAVPLVAILCLKRRISPGVDRFRRLIFFSCSALLPGIRKTLLATPL